MRREPTPTDCLPAGLKCSVTCCPPGKLSQTELQLDFRQRSGETFQSCEALTSEAADNTCGVKGPVTKIVGGLTADRYKYTWLALLGRTRQDIVIHVYIEIEILEHYIGPVPVRLHLMYVDVFYY